MNNEIFKKEELIKEIDSTFKGIFEKIQYENKSFKSNIDIVEDKMKKIVKGLYSVEELLDKYQNRIGIKDTEIQKIVGIAELGSFKKNTTFSKQKLCLLTICFQLSLAEAKELIKCASILLEPEFDIFDCAYLFYMKHYNPVKDIIKNVEEFESVLAYSKKYVAEKLLAGVK